ncbi:MAG: hypothetical protein VB078_06995 [Clostridiaceae bacterium]|nr:hypothetical protein [Clostridiaceae bacterium]
MNKPMTQEREVAILEKAIATYGVKAQMLKSIEEMCELSQALLKLVFSEWFETGDCVEAVKHISEEMADVSIMLNQLTMIFGDPTEQEIEKLERLDSRLEASCCDSAK